MRCRVFSKMMAGMMALAMVAGVMMVPAKAHAYSDENVEVIEFVEKVEEEEYGPLTPDGNLSLVMNLILQLAVIEDSRTLTSKNCLTA